MGFESWLGDAQLPILNFLIFDKFRVSIRLMDVKSKITKLKEKFFNMNPEVTFDDEIHEIA